MRFPAVPRISLREAFIVIAILAIGLAINANFDSETDNYQRFEIEGRRPTGYEEGALTGAGLLLAFLAWRVSAPGRWLRVARAAAFVAALAMLWFAAVDFSVKERWCHSCSWHGATASIRVYRIPIWSNVTVERSLVLDIANDLGVPCPHENHDEVQSLRLWGLAAPCPAVCFTRLSDEGSPTYAEIQPYVRQLAAEDPNFPSTFHRKAFVEKDRTFMQEFWQEIRQRQAKNASAPSK